MKSHAVEQNTPEWYALRLGIPTASEFDKIITPAKGDLSASARGYAMRLAAERLTQRSMEDLKQSDWMTRGKELEPSAVRLFEFAHGVKTTKVGFITSDDGRYGASPDRLIGDDGVLEIKCPSDPIHLGYLLDGFETKYKVQVQGQMLVAEADYSVRLSYHPDWPEKIERTNRDETFIRKMKDALDQFCDMVDEIVEQAKSLGMVQAAPHVVTPAEAAYGDLDDKFDRIRSDHWGNPSLEQIDIRNTYMAG